MKKWFRKRWWIVLMVLVVAGVIVSQRGRREAVTVAEAARQTITRTVLSSGKLTVPGEGRVYSQSTGTIATVLVREGDRVTTGQALFQFEAGALSNSVAQAESVLLQAQKAQAALTDQYLTESAQEALRAARDNAGDARTRAQRSYNDESTDTTKAALEAAINAHETAEANYEAAFNGQPAKIDVEAAAAAVTAARSALAEARRGYQLTTITAPAAGVISFTRDQNGVVAGVGRQLLAGQLTATITTPDSLYFEAEVDETSIPSLTLGLSTNLEFDAFLGKTFTGTISSLAGRPIINDSGSDVYLVGVTVTDAEAGFREGMSGQAEFVLESVDQVVAVPAAAVIVDKEEDVVLVVQDNTISRRVVEVGIESATATQILSGVAAGETVVVSNNVRDLSAGQEVTVTKE